MTVRIQLSRGQQEIDPNKEDWELMKRFANLFHYTVNESSFSGACKQAFESALEACKHREWTILSREEVKDDLARLAVYFKSSLVDYAISQNAPWASELINQRIDTHSLEAYSDHKEKKLKEAIESRKTILAEKKLSHPEAYPPYLEKLLEKGHIHLYDHLLDMKMLPNRIEREKKIGTLSFSEISHIILETQQSVIEQVISIVPSHVQNVLFLLGNTGAGKSTTLCFLRGDKMVVDVNGKYSSTNEQDNLIGHGKESCTFLPTVEMLNDLAVVDFPGFSDTNGSLISLGMECALKRLIDKYQPKILVLEAITNTEGRYAAAAQLGNQLKRLLGNTEGCILGITKYSNDVNFEKVQSIEAEQKRKLTSPSKEEQKLETKIETLTDLDDPSLKSKIKTLHEQLAKLKEERLKQKLEDPPETEEKTKHRQQVEEKEKELREQIGISYFIPLFDLESSQKRDQCLNRLSLLNTSVSWSTQQILDPEHEKLIKERFEKDLIPKIYRLPIFDVGDINAFERRVLESSLIKVLLSSSHPEVGEFLHLTEIDPKIIDDFSKRIVRGCIKKIVDNVIQTIDVVLIEKILEEFGEKASPRKKETLQKKQKQVQKYILGLEGSRAGTHEQVNKSWEVLRKEKQTHLATIEQGVEDRYQLSTLQKVAHLIPFGIPLSIHNSAKQSEKKEAVAGEIDRTFDRYCQSLDQIYSALIKLKGLEKIIDKREKLNIAAQSSSLSFESLECLGKSIYEGIDRVKEIYGHDDWDERVVSLRSKIEGSPDVLDLASMLYLEEDALFIVEIKGDLIRAHRFLERSAIVDDTVIVLVNDTETILLKRYLGRGASAFAASLQVEAAALQMEMIVVESVRIRYALGISLRTEDVRCLEDILEIDLKDPLSRMLLKDAIKPRLKKDWFFGKKITEKPRNLFRFEFGKSQWGTCFGDIGAEPPLPDNIGEILDRPCVFWPDKKVRETHMLVLIPNTVNGKPFNLNHLSELIREPKAGYKTQYLDYSDRSGEQVGRSSSSHWVLMTRDVIPNSRSKDYEAIEALVQTHAQQSGIPYEIPTALEAATAILMEYVKTGERLYSEKVTVCQRPVNKNQWIAAIGPFVSEGLMGENFYQEEISSLIGSWGVSGIYRL